MGLEGERSEYINKERNSTLVSVYSTNSFAPVTFLPGSASQNGSGGLSYLEIIASYLEGFILVCGWWFQFGTKEVKAKDGCTSILPGLLVPQGPHCHGLFTNTCCIAVSEAAGKPCASGNAVQIGHWWGSASRGVN